MEDWFTLPFLITSFFLIAKGQVYLCIYLFGTPFRGKWGLHKRMKQHAEKGALFPMLAIVAAALMLVVLPEVLKTVLGLPIFLTSFCFFFYSLVRSFRIALTEAGHLGAKGEWAAGIWGIIAIGLAASYYFQMPWAG